MSAFTREAIKGAFIELLDQRPMTKITVKDVVERCGVNRNTFYYYFDGLPALAEAVATEDVQKIVGDTLDLTSLQDCLDAVIRFTLDHRRAVLNLYHSTSRELFETSQWRVCQHVVEKYIDTLLAGRDIAPEDRLLLIDYLRCSLFGLLLGWLESGLEADIQGRFHRLCELKAGELEMMLERCSVK